MNESKNKLTLRIVAFALSKNKLLLFVTLIMMLGSYWILKESKGSKGFLLDASIQNITSNNPFFKQWTYSVYARIPM